jgi:RNA polymerase-binding transcription factor DksA
MASKKKTVRGAAKSSRRAPGARKTVAGGPARRPAGGKRVPVAAAKGGKGLKPRPVPAVSSREREDLKRMLVATRERLTGQIATLHGESLQRHDRVNIEEEGTDAFERQLALDLASSEQDSLYEIDEALRRIEQGTYGICEQCGCKIEKPRLKALPFVRTCVGCQSQIERANAARRRLG